MKARNEGLDFFSACVLTQVDQYTDPCLRCTSSDSHIESTGVQAPEFVIAIACYRSVLFVFFHRLGGRC